MKPQFIKTEGEELVVLPRRDYEALVKRAKKVSNEEEKIARVIKKSNDALAAGDEIELPSKVAEAIARGENPLRVIREWRGMTQMYLGEVKTDIGSLPTSNGAPVTFLRRLTTACRIR